MDFSTYPGLEKRKEADVLLLPFFQSKKGTVAAQGIGSLQELAELVLGDFKGKEGEIALVYVPKGPEKRVALLGLGSPEKLTIETLRRAYGAATKFCLAKKLTRINLLLPKSNVVDEAKSVRGISEGLLLSNYAFHRYKSSSEMEEPVFLQHVALLGAKNKHQEVAERALKIARGVYLARDLVNGNADDITPQYLSQFALDAAKGNAHLKATVLDKKGLEKEKMGLLLAVNRGSFRDPALIVLEYTGNAKSKEKVVLVGKGITYDTGGLNLKPTGSMETMKSDMAGAATVLAATLVAAQLKLDINVTAVIASTENAIGARSYKPGDVYASHSGKTVEIDNTDAEGRLVLADALSYAKKHLKPTCMVDLATLTGAMVIALGEEAAGVMSNHSELAKALCLAGQETYERLWRMPLFDEYRDQLKSDVADLKNTGGRPAGSITAGLFLQEFAGTTIPWAHIDIAGTAYLSKERRYMPKNASGFGVRLLVEFLEQFSGEYT